MKLLLACLLVAATASPALAQKKARTVEIVGSDNMKFDLATIPAKPGETLRVVLKSIGKAPKTIMGHNFVLLKLGTDVDAFNQAAFNARATDFIPPALKDKVVANTAIVGPGESVEVTFTVPSKAGSYDYICSFPGHFAMGMKGKLVVK
jgi:azurin